MAEASKLSGTERAAVLLMSLGDEVAADILKLMGPKEVQKLGGAMAGLKWLKIKPRWESILKNVLRKC